MKKLFAIVLSAALLLGTAVAVFAACGNDSSEYLTVATNAYFPPFEYYEGNAFTGVDIEIADKMAQNMGKKLYVKDMEFDSIIQSVKSGESDIGMAGITVNDERKIQVDFTDEYYESAQVIIVKSDDTTFDACTTADEIETILKAQDNNYKIGTQNGTTGYMYSYGDAGFGYDGFTNLTTNGYTTGALAVQDLANGRINAVIIDKQPALMIAESISGVKVIEDVELTSEAYAFCVAKGNTELLEKANAFLKELKDNGDLDKIINSFFDGTADYTYTNPAR
ncbi:MAG TPA: transporter substrate-binding domain-containing protein [Firmicutes bacterium]|nr:transporter substrate-binding domain-containing protein [Bacillota bacterium]